MTNDAAGKLRAGGLRALPSGIWMLGLVSLFMDTSSELIHSLLPVFLVSVLGASMTVVGVVEGIAEATALIAKVFSGAISDYLGKRKLLTVLGYGMAALTKPLFPLADSVTTVLIARFVDRIGKGIRGAPRDAMVGDIAPTHLRGASFGLRQALDTVGAFAGPLLAIVAMLYFAGHIREVFWIAVIPAVIATAILIFLVREPPRHQDNNAARSRLHWSDVKTLSAGFWGVAAIGAVLTLARFSEAFLILRASNIGLATVYVPLVLVVMNITYAASAYPAGVWSDRAGRRTVLLTGVSVLLLSDIVLALATNIWAVMGGVALWGIHLGLTQGLLATMVTDTAPERLRGTAFGFFNLLSGLTMLAASVIAGLLWDHYGPSGTFIAGAILSGLSLAGFAAAGRTR